MKTATKNLEDDHIYVLKLTDVMEAVTHSASPDIDHIGIIGLKFQVSRNIIG